MSVHSGRFCAINGVGGLRDWTASETSTPAKVVDSATKNASLRRKGPKSWSGSYNASGGLPDLMPGESFSFIGYTAPTSGIEGEVGWRLSGNAIVDSVTINWNWQSQEVLSHSVQFQGDLGLSKASGAAILDVSTPAYDHLVNAFIDWAINGAASAVWGDLVSASLTFTNPSVQYVNSSTGGLTGRKPGPAIDWTLSVVENDFAKASPALGDQVELKLYTTNALFWHLKWGIVKDFSNLNVNRTTGEIISRTVAIEMNGFDDAGVAGTIIKPGAVTFWP